VSYPKLVPAPNHSNALLPLVQHHLVLRWAILASQHPRLLAGGGACPPPGTSGACSPALAQEPIPILGGAEIGAPPPVPPYPLFCG
jgi:hypothetical protein